MGRRIVGVHVMREATIKLYHFAELPEDVQRRIFEGDQNRYSAYDCYYWEFRKTLDTFAELFDLTIKWEIDSNRYNFDFVVSDYRTAENLETIRDPLRLATWVYNNHGHLIKRGKFYSVGKWENGKYSYKSRHSKTIFCYNDLPLTGVFCDQNVLQAFIDCITYRRTFETYEDLVTTALNEFFETWRQDLEYAESFEFYRDQAAEDDITEYTERGEVWRG
jgi:hypothetical protein